MAVLTSAWHDGYCLSKILPYRNYLGKLQLMTKHILNNDSKILEAITARLNELKQLNFLFQQHVEHLLATHCQVAGIDKNCLMVIVDNGHWTTQLRFQIPTILSQLRLNAQLKNLKGIICKTRPDYSTADSRQSKQSRKMARISQQTANIILSTAQTIDDAKLRGIMEKIAGNLT